MKKYLIVLGLLIAPFVTQAAVPDGTYFFMDNKGYDETGKQTFFCFDDGTCYTVEGVLSFTREINNKIDQLNQKIDQLQNTINQLPTSTPQIIYTPAPVVGYTPPPDTTAPKILKHESRLLIWDSNGKLTNECNGVICPNSGFSFITDEPTTAVIKIYKTSTVSTVATANPLFFNNVLTWEDYLKPYFGDSEMRLKALLSQTPDYPPTITLTGSLNTSHKFLYSQFAPEYATGYGVFATFTDTNGNSLTAYFGGF